jgi:hypothetical protein
MFFIYIVSKNNSANSRIEILSKKWKNLLSKNR